MFQEKIEKYEKWIYRIVSLFIVMILFIRFHQLSPFIYQTNDDFFLSTIINGEVTGTPEAHLIHIGYPVGLLLSLFYSLLPSIPWYGLFLCFCIGITMFVVLNKLVQLPKHLFLKLLTLPIFCVLSYGFLFLHIAELQYTAVTGIVGAGAIFLLSQAQVTNNLLETLKNHIGFLLLSALSFCIRDKAFIMLLPFILVVFLWKIKLNRKNLCVLFLSFVLLLGFLFTLNKIAYSSPQWNTFKAYNTLRENIYDYNGYPDYDTNTALYEKLGISKSSYEAAANHYNILLDSHLNKNSFETIEKVSKSMNDTSLQGLHSKLKSMISSFIDRNLSYTDRPLNLLVYSCYFLFLLLALLGRKKNALLQIFLVLLARMSIWIYLLNIDRIPSRISQPIYVTELLLLFSIAYMQKLWEQKKILWTFSICFCIFLSFRFGFPKAEAAIWESKSRVQFSTSYEEITDYFSMHPEAFYYLDANSFGSFTKDALTPGEAHYANYLLMGSWLPNSPWYERKFDQKQISDPGLALLENDTVYAVFMKTDATSWDYLNAFYEENYPGSHLEVVDEFTSSNGITFEIIQG